MIPTLDIANSYKAGTPASGPTFNTWDPSYKGTLINLSNGNLTAASTGEATVISLYGKSSGIWQVEHTINDLSAGLYLGVAYQTVELNHEILYLENIWAFSNLALKTNNVGASGFGGTPNYFYVGDVIGVVVAPDVNSVQFYNNGTLIQYDPPGEEPLCSNIMTCGTDYGPIVGTVYWAYRANTGGNSGITTNFGQTNFIYPVAGASPMYGPTT